MKDVNREHLMDLINDGLDFDELIDVLGKMQDEEEAEENDRLELEDSMEEAAYALADFFFKGMSRYGLVEDGMKESDLQDSIMESLGDVLDNLKRVGELNKNLNNLDKKVKKQGGATKGDIEDLKKIMGVLFK